MYVTLLCFAGNIGEAGCSKDHHCQGGALCLDGKCQCPSGYIQAAGGSKCVKIGGELYFHKLQQ